MTNIIINIVLPPNLLLMDGSILDQEVSFMLTDQIDPWYASVDEVKLEGGIYLTKLPEITMASQIWNASKFCDALTCHEPTLPPQLTPYDPGHLGAHKYFLFNTARNRFVSVRAALASIYNVFDLAGVRGSKTLGNFSVTRMSFARDESLPKKIRAMEDELSKWKIVIQSGGEIGYGGHAKAVFAAKGKYDPSDIPAGRQWWVTGMGANHKTMPGFGSAGKPYKYGTPSFINYRVGRAFSNYVTIFPNTIFM